MNQMHENSFHVFLSEIIVIAGGTYKWTKWKEPRPQNNLKNFRLALTYRGKLPSTRIQMENRFIPSTLTFLKRNIT